MFKLYDFQKDALNLTRDKNRVAYYLEMGLGKTFVGSEKMMQLSERMNLIVCQKSKIKDWLEHIKKYYAFADACDLTKKGDLERFISHAADNHIYIGVINYELVWRRAGLAGIKENYTLMLDESSLIQNDTSKRTKFILRNLRPSNVILLSGTPTGGKYEKLWGQLKLLGWEVPKSKYWEMFIKYHYDTRQGFPLLIVDGYKNVDELKAKMREYGCVFLKTSEAFELPEQVMQTIEVPVSIEYKKFVKNRVVTINEKEIIGDTALTMLLGCRQICGAYNASKLNYLKDLLEGTEERVIIFYNFKDELEQIRALCKSLDKPVSVVNGSEKNLRAFEQFNNSITLIQYQAGAMGLNLQKANKIIYYSPTLSSEMYEQSKKRIHRIGQSKTCFYYKLVSGIEKNIYKNLDLRRDYTDALFKKDWGLDG